MQSAQLGASVRYKYTQTQIKEEKREQRECVRTTIASIQ